MTSDEPEGPDEIADEAMAQATTELFARAVLEAVRVQSFSGVRDFVDREVDARLGGGLDPKGRRALVWGLARAAWSSAPLPGSGYRQVRLQEPGRNDPCPCGSGDKYKKCCAGIGGGFPPLPEEEAWAVVAPQLTVEEAVEALKDRRLPPEGLAPLAERLRELGLARKASRLLDKAIWQEPRPGRRLVPAIRMSIDLDADRRGPAAALERALGILPDLGREARPGVERLLVLVAVDAGRMKVAADLVQSAARSDPRHPELAFVEVVVRLVENRLDEAARRARLWLERLLEAGPDEESEGLVEFLERAADDPARAREELKAEADRLESPGDDEREGQSDDDAADADDDWLPQLDWIGELSSLVKGVLDRPIVSHPLEARGGESALGVPEALAEALAEWRAAWPCPKPRLTSLEVDAWRTIKRADRWLDVLRRRPGAFDLVEVLDDIAVAAGMASDEGEPGADEALYAPLVSRGAATVEHSLAAGGAARLPWSVAANRPALRLLTLQALEACAEGPPEPAIVLLARILALNPSDNHGHRERLATLCLRAGQPERVLEIAALFPGDALPGLLFGRGLALLRLGREEEARAALREAAEQRPRVAWALLAPPEEIEAAWDRVFLGGVGTGGMRVGGEEEALEYRDDAIGEWEKTPAALDVLRESTAP